MVRTCLQHAAYLTLMDITLLHIVLQVLKERDFPYSNLKLLASARCIYFSTRPLTTPQNPFYSLFSVPAMA